MNKTSSLIEHLRKSAGNAEESTSNILSAYTSSTPVRDVFSARQDYQSAIHTLKDCSSDDLKYKFQADYCHAHLTNMVQKQIELGDIAEQAILDFEETLSKHCIALELTYKLNQIALLPDRLTKKIELKNTVNANYLMNKLNSISKVLELIKDIKAIGVEAVENDISPTLTAVEDVFSSEIIFKHKLNDFLSQDNFTSDTRLEIIQPLIASTSAANASYNNLACSSIFKTFGKIASSLAELRDFWFSSQSKLSSTVPSRYKRICKDVQNQENPKDTLEKYEAANEHLKRINKTTNLVVNVIYPTVLKEISTFSNTLEQLGVYKALDERVKDIVIEDTCMTGYATLQGIGEDIKFMRFAQTRNPKMNTHYVPKCLSYCVRRQKGLNEYLGKVLSMFNLTEVTERTPRPTAKLYSISQMNEYINKWQELYYSRNDMLATLIGSETPLTNWDTFNPDMLVDTYSREMAFEKLKYSLDIVPRTNADIVSPILYESSLRDGVDAHRSTNSLILGWGNQDSQHELRLSLQRCLDESESLTRNISELNKLIQKFPEPHTQPNAEKLVVMYNFVNDILQWNNWIQHDLSVIEKVYA